MRTWLCHVGVRHNFSHTGILMSDITVEHTPDGVVIVECKDLPGKQIIEPGDKMKISTKISIQRRPRCCVCGTTENLTKDGWYGYRCDSPECVCF